MPAYNFRAQFVPKILEGSKAHTIRGDRLDSRVPVVGELLVGYCGMRTKWSTWLFSSGIARIERIEMDLSKELPRIRLDGEEQSCRAVVEMITADGFDDVGGFNAHFARYVSFSGWLIHWNPEDALRCAREHACRRCGERLCWSERGKAFYCQCDDETFHYLKRPNL